MLDNDCRLGNQQKGKRTLMKRIYNREQGQGLVEYALILVFVVLIVLVMLLIFGPRVGEMFSTVVDIV